MAWLFVTTLASLATNIAPRLVPRRGVDTAWRAWYPRGFGPSGSPRGMHKHSTLHTTFRKIQKIRAVQSLDGLLLTHQTNQVNIYCQVRLVLQSALCSTGQAKKY